jgi:hypothetical protein
LDGANGNEMHILYWKKYFYIGQGYSGEQCGPLVTMQVAQMSRVAHGPLVSMIYNFTIYVDFFFFKF